VGVYAVTGNLIITQGREGNPIMRAANIKVLRNELEVLSGGLQFWVSMIQPEDGEWESRVLISRTPLGVESFPTLFLLYQPSRFNLKKRPKQGSGIQ